MPLNYSILVLAIPLLMFLFLGLAGVKMEKKLTGWLGVLGMGATMVVCYGVALNYFFSPEFIKEGVRQAVVLRLGLAHLLQNSRI